MTLLAFQPLLEGRIDARWLVVLRGLAAAALLALLWRHYVELRSPPRGDSSPRRRAGPNASPADWLFAVAVGLAIFGAWLAFDSGWAAFETGPGFVPLKADGSLDLTLVALRLFGLVLVVPVMEELFWRSFLLRWIERRDFLAADPKRASVLAFSLSSALFSTEHSLWFAGLLAGAAYTWVYTRTGNLRLSIVSHATTNGTLGLWILATGSWRFW